MPSLFLQSHTGICPQITLGEVESPHSINSPCSKAVAQGWFTGFNLNQKRGKKGRREKKTNIFKASLWHRCCCGNGALPAALTVCVALSSTETLLMFTHWWAELRGPVTSWEAFSYSS